MNKLFRLRENNTSIRTEMVAGLTTFFTMAYIIFVNPSILAQTGMDYNSVLVATCLSAAVGTLFMGLLANYPFAQAPGMGLNAFFTYTVVFQMGYSWQQALGMVFISGILFLVLTVTGMRAAIVHAIPATIRHAIPAGIGLFIAFIGLNNAGIIRVNQGPIIDIISSIETVEKTALIEAVNQAPPQVLEVGNLGDPAVLLAVIGFIIMAVLMVLKVKGAIFLGILAVILLGIPMGVTQIPDAITTDSISLAPTFFELDLLGLLQLPEGNTFFHLIITLLTIIISFSLVDLFDTIGTLLGTADKGGFLDEKGKLPRMHTALFSDAAATTLGAMLGTSTVTTYIESGTGVAVGGKTGLTAVVVAILFLLSIFLTPIAGIVPGAATAPALIMVGVLMVGSLRRIQLDDLEEALPAFATFALMPFTYSIANGIAGGIIFFVLIKLIKRKHREVHPILYFLAGLFVLRFVLV